jgi:hypothetical protein
VNSVINIVPIFSGFGAMDILNVTQYLDKWFSGRWISYGGMLNCPVHSPDISPLDYHVSGHVKRMCMNASQTQDELLQRILGTAEHINSAVFHQDIMHSPVKRMAFAAKLMTDILNNCFKLHKLYFVIILSFSWPLPPVTNS